MRVPRAYRHPDQTRDPLRKGATPLRRMPGEPPRPVYYRIDRARRIIRVLPDRWEAFEDILATVPDLPDHPHFYYTFGKMWDLSQLDWHTSPDQIVQMIDAFRTLPRHPHGGKNAIMMKLKDHQALRPLHPNLTTPRKGRVNRCFCTYFEAESWLLAPLFTPDRWGEIHIPPEHAGNLWGV